MVIPTLGLVLDLLKKINNKRLGGPGIRTQVPRGFPLARLPIQPSCLFVNEIHNKYYIENSIIMLENKKNKREI